MREWAVSQNDGGIQHQKRRLLVKVNLVLHLSLYIFPAGEFLMNEFSAGKSRTGELRGRKGKGKRRDFSGVLSNSVARRPD